MKDIIVFLGPPGSGKGTQASFLKDQFDYDELSTGDLIRKEISTNSDLGKEVAAIIDRGELINDDLCFKLLVKKLENDDKNKIIIDGFPRTFDQAKLLNDYLSKNKNFNLKKIFIFVLSDEEIINRIKNRIVCPKCNSIYSLIAKKPLKDGICDVCETPLVARNDDFNQDSIIKRNNIFKNNIKDIISFYEKKDLIFKINTSKTAEDVNHDIVNILNNNL
jgi:adenylate kinase